MKSENYIRFLLLVAALFVATLLWESTHNPGILDEPVACECQCPEGDQEEIEEEDASL